MAARKRLAVLCSTDYATYPVGGMMSFIKDAAPELARRFDVDFWGVDAGAGVDSFITAGQRFPVRHFGSVKTGRRLLPNMLRVTWHLWRNRKALWSGGYEGLYIHGLPLNAALPLGRPGPKVINHVHGLTNPFLMHGTPGPAMRQIARTYERFRRSVTAKSDLVLLAADHIGIDAFRAAHPGATRIEKIENFCDTTIFGASAAPLDRAAHGLGDADRLIVHVGRFAYQKDPLLALRAFAAYAGSAPVTDRLVMIGDGPLLDEGKMLARTLGIADRVRFMGHQPRDVIASWLAAADLYLYTSHANGYPISLAEAAQSGLPIVSTAVTGVHDLVLPGETGALVQDRDPASFAAPIAETLANRHVYGTRAREMAARFTPEIILDRLCREIADVL